MASTIPVIWLSSIATLDAKGELSTQRLIEEPCYLTPYDEPSIQEEFDRIDDCDGGGNTGPTEPYRAPSIPANIDYALYTNDNKINVKWPSSNGYGFSVQYELFEQMNNGSWVKVYDGYGTNITLQNKGQGKYSFKVLAKNSKYKTGFKQGLPTVIDPLVTENLMAKYPVLSTVEQKSTAYKQENEQFKTSTPISGQTNSPYSNNMLSLGVGYDVIRGALINQTCLNTQHPDFNLVQTLPTVTEEFDISYVQENTHLATLLNVSDSAKIGFGSGDYTLGFSNEQSRYQQSVTDESHVRFVVKFIKRAESWRLNTPFDHIAPELTNNVLSPNNDEAKRDFRSFCGDDYVNSVNIGSALYLVFSFDAKKYTYTERENEKSGLNLVLSKYFKADGSGSSNSELKLKLDQLKANVSAYQQGGPSGIAISITKDNVIDKYNQFVSGTNSTNWATVDFTTNSYNKPYAFSSYGYDQIFADYRGNQGPKAQMRRWLNLSVQHAERCKSWAEYGQATPAECAYSETEMKIAMSNCIQTSRWDQCVYPTLHNTGSLSTINNSTNFITWLDANVEKLRSESTSESYRHHAHRTDRNISDFTCLSANSCFANIHKGSGVGVNKGFTARISYKDEVKSLSHNVSPQHCVNTTAFLDPGTCLFCDTTADLNYTMEFDGMCPETTNFIIIP